MNIEEVYRCLFGEQIQQKKTLDAIARVVADEAAPFQGATIAETITNYLNSEKALYWVVDGIVGPGTLEFRRDHADAIIVSKPVGKYKFDFYIEQFPMNPYIPQPAEDGVDYAEKATNIAKKIVACVPQQTRQKYPDDEFMSALLFAETFYTGKSVD